MNQFPEQTGSFARNKQCINKCGNSSNSRRFSAADTEALKRLAAIDSLIEAVSSDQQLSKIESLVDELSLKLRKIEEQNGLDDSAIDFIGDEANVIPDPKKDSMKKVCLDIQITILHIYNFIMKIEINKTKKKKKTKN